MKIRPGSVSCSMAAGSIFSGTPMAWHSQAAKYLIYPEAFYEHSLQTRCTPQHRQAAPHGHALDILARMDPSRYLRLSSIYFVSTRKNNASRASPHFIKTHIFQKSN